MVKEKPKMKMESEKELANNIDCPECRGENCIVNENSEGVSIHCDDCGHKDYHPHEYEENGFCTVCNKTKPTRMVKKDDFHRVDICRDCMEEM